MEDLTPFLQWAQSAPASGRLPLVPREAMSGPHPWLILPFHTVYHVCSVYLVESTRQGCCWELWATAKVNLLPLKSVHCEDEEKDARRILIAFQQVEAGEVGQEKPSALAQA